VQGELKGESTNLIIILLLIMEEKLQGFFTNEWLMMSTPSMALLDWLVRRLRVIVVFYLICLARHLPLTVRPHEGHPPLGVVSALLNFLRETRIGLAAGDR
jgi:hypothetical protein